MQIGVVGQFSSWCVVFLVLAVWVRGVHAPLPPGLREEPFTRERKSFASAFSVFGLSVPLSLSFSRKGQNFWTWSVSPHFQQRAVFFSRSRGWVSPRLVDDLEPTFATAMAYLSSGLALWYSSLWTSATFAMPSSRVIATPRGTSPARACFPRSSPACQRRQRST